MRGTGVNDAGPSSSDERWPLMAVLTWISTRSRRYAEQFAFADPARAEQLLFEAGQKEGAPFEVSYAAAFHSLLEKIRVGEITGLGAKIQWSVAAEHEQLPVEEGFALASSPIIFEACEFHPQKCLNIDRGPGYTPGVHDFVFHNGVCLTSKGSGTPNPDGSRTRWTWKGVTFSRQEVMRLWEDFPFYAAWKKAKAQAWEPPQGISPEWLKNLSPGQHVLLSDAVQLLAFGPSRSPAGLSAIDSHAATLCAGLALMHAARDTKVTLLAREASQHLDIQYAVQTSGPLRKIRSEELADITMVIDGAPNWLGPSRFADGYPEAGHAAESVRFADVRVLRDKLHGWLKDLSGKPTKKRGRKEAFPWAKLEQETFRLMEYHDDFSADDPTWSSQAKLEEKLLEYCVKLCGREPGRSTLRGRLGPWLNNWRSNKTSGR
jgi:hypothetical protein